MLYYTIVDTDILLFMNGDETMEQLSRINHDIEIMGGKACIKGTRVTVGMLITQISEGKAIEDLLLEFPYLEHEDIMQALMYAAWTVDAREGMIVSA